MTGQFDVRVKRDGSFGYWMVLLCCGNFVDCVGKYNARETAAKHAHQIRTAVFRPQGLNSK